MSAHKASTRSRWLATARVGLGAALFGVALAFLVVAALELRYSGWQVSLMLCAFAVVLALAGLCARSVDLDEPREVDR